MSMRVQNGILDKILAMFSSLSGTPNRHRAGVLESAPCLLHPAADRLPCGGKLWHACAPLKRHAVEVLRRKNLPWSQANLNCDPAVSQHQSPLVRRPSPHRSFLHQFHPLRLLPSREATPQRPHPSRWKRPGQCQLHLLLPACPPREPAFWEHSCQPWWLASLHPQTCWPRWRTCFPWWPSHWCLLAAWKLSSAPFCWRAFFPFALFRATPGISCLLPLSVSHHCSQANAWTFGSPPPKAWWIFQQARQSTLVKLAVFHFPLRMPRCALSHLLRACSSTDCCPHSPRSLGPHPRQVRANASLNDVIAGTIHSPSPHLLGVVLHEHKIMYMCVDVLHRYLELFEQPLN